MKAGWVFSIKVVVNDPTIKTVDMIKDIQFKIDAIQSVVETQISEDFTKSCFNAKDVGVDALELS